MRKKKPDGLESKVLKINPGVIFRDNLGRYIPYCDFSYHRGFIKNEEVCKYRQCGNYHKLYINKNTKQFR